MIEQFIKQKCRELNIDLIISLEDKIDVSGVLCNGAFSYKPNLNIKIAKGNKSTFDYESLLLHEFCHALQYIEKQLDYMKLIGQDRDIDEIVDDWLNHRIEIDTQILNEYVSLLVAVELDCEKRVVELVKQENFNIDIVTYVKKGNSYLLFYKKMLKERMWYNHAPYLIEEIWSEMPEEFMDIPLTPEYDRLLDLCF